VLGFIVVSVRSLVPPAVYLCETWPCYVSATCRSTSKSSVLQQREGGEQVRREVALSSPFPGTPSFLSLMRQGVRIVCLVSGEISGPWQGRVLC